jgi:hypothetical protein
LLTPVILVPLVDALLKAGWLSSNAGYSEFPVLVLLDALYCPLLFFISLCYRLLDLGRLCNCFDFGVCTAVRLRLSFVVPW